MEKMCIVLNFFQKHNVLVKVLVYVIAVQMAVGLEDGKDKKVYRLPTMRRLGRGREKKSGRKAPRTNDYDVTPAPYSFIATGT